MYLNVQYYCVHIGFGCNQFWLKRFYGMQAMAAGPVGLWPPPVLLRCTRLDL